MASPPRRPAPNPQDDSDPRDGLDNAIYDVETPHAPTAQALTNQGLTAQAPTADSLTPPGEDGVATPRDVLVALSYGLELVRHGAMLVAAEGQLRVANR